MRTRKIVKYIPLTVVFVLLLSSCKVVNTQPEMDDQIIQRFLTVNNLKAEKEPSGLYYIMTSVGTGVSPSVTSTVEVKYTGYLVDGIAFDKTATDKTFTSVLSRLIKGWQIGVPLMKKGGKATFFIPSALGYGNQAAGIIPANSVIIFDIELIDVK